MTRARIRRALVAVSNVLAAACERAAGAIEDAARHLRRCPECGRSTFYGAPCVPAPECQTPTLPTPDEAPR